MTVSTSRTPATRQGFEVKPKRKRQLGRFVSTSTLIESHLAKHRDYTHHPSKPYNSGTVSERFSKPMKLAVIFAACAYLWTVALAFVPPSRANIPPLLVFLMCPACIFTVTVDPSFSTVAILLAPMNALVYGVIGICLGSLSRSSQS